VHAFGFQNNSGNGYRVAQFALQVTTSGELMVIKISVLAGALAIGLATVSYAQTPSPAGQGTTEQQSGNTGPNSGSGASTRPTGTTGTSSGGGSNMGATGSPNGSPAMAPKTITGPAGAASKTESPAR
jgi:hypothetical protein